MRRTSATVAATSRAGAAARRRKFALGKLPAAEKPIGLDVVDIAGHADGRFGCKAHVLLHRPYLKDHHRLDLKLRVPAFLHKIDHLDQIALAPASLNAPAELSRDHVFVDDVKIPAVHLLLYRRDDPPENVAAVTDAVEVRVLAHHDHGNLGAGAGQGDGQPDGKRDEADQDDFQILEHGCVLTLWRAILK